MVAKVEWETQEVPFVIFWHYATFSSSFFQAKCPPLSGKKRFVSMKGHRSFFRHNTIYRKIKNSEKFFDFQKYYFCFSRFSVRKIFLSPKGDLFDHFICPVGLMRVFSIVEKAYSFFGTVRLFPKKKIQRKSWKNSDFWCLQLGRSVFYLMVVSLWLFSSTVNLITFSQ